MSFGEDFYIQSLDPIIVHKQNKSLTNHADIKKTNRTYKLCVYVFQIG